MHIADGGVKSAIDRGFELRSGQF